MCSAYSVYKSQTNVKRKKAEKMNGKFKVGMENRKTWKSGKGKYGRGELCAEKTCQNTRKDIHCPKTTADSSDAEDLVNEPTSDAVASINVVQVSTSSNAEDPVITSKEKKNKVKLQNSVKSFFMKKWFIFYW